ncbi:hypothetical protein [Corynebacterium uterequi]|uniref:SPOR domain-containing protein n=1 Tax=Corynebacterium uterequi TaxID=1072256 RepID=A0A0G3HDU4_9CORY|nr:hypothetical protein [Corynebacterium uterequi]AKK11541.1 hypothetical protein CUTER_07760 [Corynebacterium uterequi]
MTDTSWYFDPTTRSVSQGKQKGWDRRMGPYASREEAENALNLAAQRNDAADAYDAAEDDDEVN